MNILFAASQLYFPQLYGGVQTSTDQLCHALKKKGHKVSLLVSLMPGGIFGWRTRIHMQANKRLAGCKVARDIGYGYPIWRTWFPAEAVEYVCRKERPDLIVIMSGGKILPVALEANKTGIPMLVQLHDVALGEDYGDRLSEFGKSPFVANSQFTAHKYERDYGISSSVIYPFIDVQRYRTKTTRENVTFINPVPQKGLEIALQVARHCPDIPFSFVEGWTLSSKQRAALEHALAELPNVTLLRSQQRMAPIFGRCKILLAPSVFSETYGRVVTEAQTSGIPVVTSRRGALPETVGPGGVVVDPDGPITEWVEAVRRLWHDPAYYNTLSAHAYEHTARPALDVSYQTEKWEKAFEAAAHNKTG